MAILNLYDQFEPSPWQLLQLGFFSLKFHFGKSPPLSIKPEVHRVGELTWRCLDWRARTQNRQQKSRPKAAILCNGASDRARTGDPRFTRAVLYQLSYAGGHVVTQVRRQRLSMIRDIAHPRKCSDGFSHFKCTNIGDVMSRSYESQTEWDCHGSTQDPSHAYR